MSLVSLCGPPSCRAHDAQLVSGMSFSVELTVVHLVLPRLAPLLRKTDTLIVFLSYTLSKTLLPCLNFLYSIPTKCNISGLNLRLIPKPYLAFPRTHRFLECALLAPLLISLLLMASCRLHTIDALYPRYALFSPVLALVCLIQFRRSIFFIFTRSIFSALLTN